MKTAIDLFAGLGGTTAGASDAGVQVLWAANHWAVAVEAHRRNHPETQCLCQDLHQADWSIVPAHDILLSSPECRGHTPARGREQPRHDASRSTAWATVSCAEVHRPNVVVTENVPGFRDWDLYPAWQLAMKRLGYRLIEEIVDAADCGVGQHRVRLFVIASKRRRALRLRKRRHKAAGEIIDFKLPATTEVRALCERTRERVARGRKQFGKRFLVSYYSNGSGLGGISLDRPLGTVTTKARWALVDGNYLRMLSVDEYRAAMGFSPGYWLPSNQALAIHLLGNAVCPPVMKSLLEALN